jgi:hypothetical protein
MTERIVAADDMGLTGALVFDLNLVLTYSTRDMHRHDDMRKVLRSNRLDDART